MKSTQNSLLDVARGAAILAGSHLKSKKVEVIKSWDKDIKITADIEAHALILHFLREHSDIPIISEEDKVGENQLSGLRWIVDPLDGSLNFSRGIPNCAVSIGLMDESEPILGAVYDFNRDEMFSGIVGEGATLNEEKIFVSKISDKNEAVIMTGLPSYTDYSEESLKKYISTVQSFKKVRLIGSAALSLTYVACGRADAYFEKDIKIWDVIAGLALVKAAGGCHTTLSLMKDNKLDVYASNGTLPLEF